MRSLLIALCLASIGALPQAPKLPQAPTSTVCDCEATRRCTCWDTQCVCSACKTIVPALRYNADHTCPNCRYTSPPGQGTWVVKRFTTGGHVHSCPNCGTEWFH